MKPLHTLSLFLILAACNAAPDRRLESPPSPHRTEAYQSTVRRPDLQEVCLAPGATCPGNTDCCEGTFCSSELFVYGETTCIGPQPDGSYCQLDSHCSGGHCVGSICYSG